MTQVLLLFLLGKGNFYFKHGLIFILLLTQGDAQSTLNLYMASEAALFPSRTGANVQRQMISISSCLVSRQLSLQLKKIRWESQRKHAFFFSEEYSVLFSCHAFARGFGWFVAWNFSFRTVTMCSLSHSSVLQTEPCQQSQQVWVHRRLEHCTEHPREEQKRKLKKKKKKIFLLGKINITGFSECLMWALTPRQSGCLPRLKVVVLSSPDLRVSAASRVISLCSSWVQFEGSEHCRGPTWAQRSRDIGSSLCNKPILIYFSH